MARRAETDPQAAPNKTKYRPGYSKKPPIIKTEVIARRAMGQSKSQIARETEIAYNTVNCIIEESKVDELIEGGRLGCAKLIPKAVGVVDQRLDQGSESAAFGILNPLVLRGNQESVRRRSMMEDPTLQKAIRDLLGPDRNDKPIDVVPVPSKNMLPS